MLMIIVDVLQGMGAISLLSCALLYVFSVKQRIHQQYFKSVVFDRLLGQVITKHAPLG